MGHRSSFLIKLSFGIGHPQRIYQMQCICVREGSTVPNLQTEFNYLDSFKSYGIFSDFVVPTWSPWSPHHPRCPHIIPVIPVIPMSSPHHPHVIPIAPEGPHVVPKAVVSVVSTHVVHVVPVVPIVRTSSPHCLEGPQIIPNPSDTHPTHTPTPLGG